MTDDQNQKNLGELVLKMADIKTEQEATKKSGKPQPELKPFQLLTKDKEILQMMDDKLRDGREVIAE